MKKWKVYLVALSVLVLIGLIASNISWSITVDKLEQQLEQRQVMLEKTEVKLENVRTELEQYQKAAYDYEQMVLERGDELRELAVKFTSSQAELYNTRHKLKVTQDEMETAQVELATARAEHKTAKSELEAYYQERLSEEFQKGREIGYAEALGQEVSRHDPTYDEMWRVLRELAPAISKGIIEIRDSNGEVSCSDFAMLVDSLAESKGLRTGFVFLVYKYTNGGKWGHFLNSFETSDKGRVYMDYFFSSFDVKGVKVGNNYLGFEDSLIKEIMIAW